MGRHYSPCTSPLKREGGGLLGGLWLGPMTHNPHLAYTQKFPTQLENATQPRLSSRTFAFHSRRTTCPQNPYWLHLTLNVQIPSYRSNSTYKVSNWLDFTTWMKTSILNLPFNRERKKKGGKMSSWWVDSYMIKMTLWILIRVKIILVDVFIWVNESY